MLSARLENGSGIVQRSVAEWDGLALMALFAGLAALLLSRWQIFTGDETRYLMYAVSILEHGRFVMTLSEWQRLWFSITGAHALELPAGDQHHTILFNGVYLSTILSPIAVLFSLTGLRIVTLLTGFFGLFYVWRLCGRVSSRAVALFGVAVAALSIPLIGYLHLFYMETYLFALIACAWERLQKTDRSLAGDFVTALILVATPFVHLRGSVLAAALYLVLIWQVFRRGLTGRGAALCVLALVACALLSVLNVGIYGSIAGPVNHARPPLPWQWFPVVSMQLFSVHHGLLAYAPIWAVGYAGLVAGTIRRSKMAREGLVLAAIAGITGIGIYPGECWTARFWVSSVPMLAVGFCTWLTLARRPSIRLLAVPLLVVTSANSIVFVLHPNLFLDNRIASATYQWLFDKIGHFNIALVLPPEIYEWPYLRTAELLTAAALLFVGAMVMTVVWCRVWAICTAAAVLMLLAAGDLTRASTMRSEDFAASFNKDRVTLVFHDRPKMVHVRFGEVSPSFWNPNDRIDLYELGTGPAASVRSFPANEVVLAACQTGLKQIEVRNRGSIDLEVAARSGLVLYRSDSWLVNHAGFGVPRC